MNNIAFNLMPEGKQSNYFFNGTASLKFSNTGQAEGLGKQGFSNGAAYADLDNDGDLDLVINNLNGAADIYQNNSRSRKESNYLSVHLEGNSFNRFGLGAAIIVSSGNKKMYRYNTATRGFESCSTGDIHIGLGDISIIDTLKVIWPDSLGTVQELYHIKANQRITLQQNQASYKNHKAIALQTLLTNITKTMGINFVHKENFFNDFAVQPLMPHGVSTEGPKLAVGDVNADGLDDFYACGAAG